MLFNSLEFGIFLGFFAVAYGIAGAHPARDTLRRWVILIGSLAFYGYWHPPYLILFLVCLLTNWLAVRALDRLPHRGRGAFWVVTASIVFNLGVLGVYKYTEFFLRTLNWSMAAMGTGHQSPIISFMLPLGISFFTFQMLAYTVDVYREGKAHPVARGFVGYSAFVAFFPQLIAGPIVRGSELLPQIAAARTVTGEAIWSGLLLFLWGLSKKVILSDRLGPFVSEVFTDPTGLHWAGHWLAIYCFAFQIYCDFSGYSDMCMGLGRMFGFQIPLNFKEPYLSPNITVFWRRWHITLSSWLRDYLYIPLGGSRLGRLFTYRNLLLTMLLGGLWHGANWVFVLWGLMHGLYLAADRLRMNLARTPRPEGSTLATAADRQQATRDDEGDRDPWLSPWYWIGCIVTFHMVCLTWVFFRAGLNTIVAGQPTPWQVSMMVFKAVFTFQGGDFWVAGWDALPILALAGVLHIVERFVRHHRPGAVQAVWSRIPDVGQAVLVGLIMLGMVIFGGEQFQFIYFAF